MHSFTRMESDFSKKSQLPLSVLKFLRLLDTQFPGDVPLHLIMDNYGTHKHAKVKAWLKRHPRFVSHFVPTSSSWMNPVERWFGHLDSKAIRRGVFLSVADLQAAIEAFLQASNQNPQPFVWTATVESIQQKLTRCRRTLEQIQPAAPAPNPESGSNDCLVISQTPH
jgi:transposase